MHSRNEFVCFCSCCSWDFFHGRRFIDFQHLGGEWRNILQYSKEASMFVPPFVYRLACLCFCLFLINYPNMQTNNTSWIFFLGWQSTLQASKLFAMVATFWEHCTQTTMSRLDILRHDDTVKLYFVIFSLGSYICSIRWPILYICAFWDMFRDSNDYYSSDGSMES